MLSLSVLLVVACVWCSLEACQEVGTTLVLGFVR